MSRLCLFSNGLGSGEIRARQIADFMPNAVLDPSDVSSEDTLVLVKSYCSDHIAKSVRKVYFDVVDCHGVIPKIRDNTDAGIISIGRSHEIFMRMLFPDREIVLIPEHHCNFDRIRRPDRPVKVVGFMGDAFSLNCDICKLSQELAKAGLSFKYSTFFRNRQDVVDFYKDVDISVSFRSDGFNLIKDPRVLPLLKNPLKVINAGSFGIPTVSYPETCYECEIPGLYIPVLSLDDLVHSCKLLAFDVKLYKQYSDAIFKVAEEYHIERIAKLYEQLIA